MGGSFVNRLKRKPIAIENFLTDFKWNVEIPMNEENLPVKQVLRDDPQDEDMFAGLKKKQAYSQDVRNPKGVLKFESTGDDF